MFINKNPSLYVPKLILASTFVLLVFNMLYYFVNGESTEGIYSSFRLLIESLFIFTIFKYQLVKFKSLVIFIIAVSSLNSLFVIVQVLESLGTLNTNFNSIIDFWGVRNEFMRKSGFLNSILTSSYIIFFGFILNLMYRPNIFKYFVIIQILALFFSARTFLMPAIFIIPILFLLHLSPKLLTKVVIVIILSSQFFYLIDVNLVDNLILHFNERVAPAFQVIFEMDLDQDYSSKDLVSHYRVPTFSEFLIGNGFPRYSDLGGRDPTYSRWLLQSGFISFSLIFFINTLLLVCSFYRLNIYNISLGLVFFLSAFKGELTTGTALFSLSFLYFYLGSRDEFIFKENKK